jgi:hypothetical protein
MMHGDIDMKASLKTRPRPSPDDAVRIAAAAEPSLPPTRLPHEDKQLPFSTRLRASTLAAIEARARSEGTSLKLVICRALADAGIEVAAADLEDGTPRRRRAA